MDHPARERRTTTSRFVPTEQTTPASRRLDARREAERMLRSARERHAYAQGQIVRFRLELEHLAAHAARPACAEHNTYASATLLLEAYTAMAALQAIAIAVHADNMQGFEAGRTPEEAARRLAATEAASVEQRRRLDLAMARYLVRYHAAGIDAILLAAGHPGLIVPVDDDHRREREADGAALQAAATLSGALGKLVSRLGDDLAEVRQLARWGTDGFARLAGLPPEARKAFLRDASWTRLERHLDLLRGLYERCEPYAPLRRRLQPWRPDRPAWAEAELATAPRLAARTRCGTPPAASAETLTLASGRGPASRIKLA